MFDIGWRVFLLRLPDLVTAPIRRRLVVVGGLTASVSFIGFLVLFGFDGSFAGGVRQAVAAVVTALLFASGLGCFALVFCRIGPRGWSIPALPAVGWRTQEAVARYYRRSPPPVAREHRDIVLDGVRTGRDPLVRATLQGSFLLVAWCSGLVGTVILTATSDPTTTPLFLYAPVWPLIGGATAIWGLRTLGRQEQLRVEAEALPPVMPPPPRRGRPGGPSGSKLALPGE